ncbi:MAG: ATP-binding cassette domain-containing protein [Pseudomonadota bacterium]
MIEISNLFTKAGHQVILQDINMSVRKGEIRGLIGSSGSGKTSLLRAIAGLNSLCSGEICLSGQTVSTKDRMTPSYQRRTSMVFQSLALWPHMTVRKHLEFVIQKKQFGDHAQQCAHIESLLDMMHLTSYQNRYPAQLSGGEQQRLAIARALAPDPEYLLMDEPFSSLDDILKQELLDIVLSLKHKGRMTIVYVTHNIDEALYLADHINTMRNGKIMHHIENNDALTKADITRLLKGLS